jgi:hypothetical protein
MATRITYQFPTFYGETYRVDIDDADFVGTALTVDVASDGFTLTYDGKTDSVNPGIMGSTCAASIIVTPENVADIETFATDLIESVESRFTLAVYKITAGPTTSLYWAGYVIRELGSFDDTGSVYKFTIKATDGLARLKASDYKDAAAVPSPAPYGKLSLLDHVLNCLSEVGLTSYWGGTDVFIRTVVNWQDGNMPTATAAKDPLQYSRVSGEAFAKRVKSSDGEDWEYIDVYAVLQEICENWGARLMLSNGAWRFEQIRERMEALFFERRYATDGTLLTYSASSGYDKPVIQVGEDNRLSGGQFHYLPALARVEVKYDHKTYKNYLENLSWKWYKDSGANTPYAVTGLAFDSDTYFRVRGNLFVNVSVVTYTKPWRYVFGLIIKTTPGNYRIDSETTSIAPGGVGIPTLNREQPNWQVASTYYEVSTPWIYSTNYTGVIPNEFALFTPYIPSGQTGFSVDFSTGLGGRDYAGSSVTATLNDWRFSNLELSIQGFDNASNYEVERKYVTNNTNTGNSEILKIETLFGAAVKSWTVARLETTDDATFTLWDATTATWERANENQNLEFGDLLANQLQKLQAFPVQLYTGTLLADATHIHSRITFLDNTTWLINRGEWRARENQWTVEMALTGVADDADLDTTTPVGNPEDAGIFGTFPPGLVVAPGSGTGTTTATGFHGETALSFLTGNTVSTGIAPGTVTSIPVGTPVKGGSIRDNDIIYIVDPQSGQVFTFVVNGDVADGATSITVDSSTTTVNIPIGAPVVPSPLNIYTTAGGTGGTGAVIPDGTAPGQALIWNDSASEWEAYSGTVDGHVFTWDTTLGWQAEAPTGGGGASGDINDGGNNTGATIIIGTNDANALQFETNGVSRVNISGAASTGGAVTITDITANTSTPENVLTLIANSTGAALAGLGSAILFQAESTTTDSTTLGRLFYAWLTATHVSRASKLAIEVVNAASTIEIASFDATNSGAGRLLIGASSPAVYSGTGITTAAAFEIGNSAQTLNITSSANSTAAIQLNASNNTNGRVTVGGSNYSHTSGIKRLFATSGNHTSSTGTGAMTAMRMDHTINQTGSASGNYIGIEANYTLTSLLGTLYVFYSTVNHANVKGVYIAGASTTNNMEGATAFGTTSAPHASAIVDIVSTAKGLGLPAMATTERDAISSPRDGLAIYNVTLYTLDLRANGAWVSLGTGSGTVTGSGTANHIAYWSGTSAITGEAALYYDPTNNRLGINQSSPTKRISMVTADGNDGILIESDGTLDQDVSGLQMQGTATGPYVQRGSISLDVYSNGGSPSFAEGQAIVFNMSTDAGSNMQPMSVYKNQLSLNYAGNFTIQGLGTGNRLRIESAGGVFSTANVLLTNASYTTNDTAARLKLVGIGTTSSNFGLKIHDGSNNPYFYARDDQKIGIGVDPADAKVQIKGDGTTTAKSLLVENSSGTDNFYVQDNGLVTGQAFQNNSSAPTMSYAAGAGTGPTTDILVGGQNCALLLFTTGTGPSASDTVFTMNLPKSFANGCAASWVAYNAATQPIIGNFWLSASGNNSITVKYAGTLAASTQYGLSITIMGY